MNIVFIIGEGFHSPFVLLNFITASTKPQYIPVKEFLLELKNYDKIKLQKEISTLNPKDNLGLSYFPINVSITIFSEEDKKEINDFKLLFLKLKSNFYTLAHFMNKYHDDQEATLLFNNEKNAQPTTYYYPDTYDSLIDSLFTYQEAKLIKKQLFADNKKKSYSTYDSKYKKLKIRKNIIRSMIETKSLGHFLGYFKPFANDPSPKTITYIIINQGSQVHKPQELIWLNKQIARQNNILVAEKSVQMIEHVYYSYNIFKKIRHHTILKLIYTMLRGGITGSAFSLIVMLGLFILTNILVGYLPLIGLIIGGCISLYYTIINNKTLPPSVKSSFEFNAGAVNKEYLENHSSSQYLKMLTSGKEENGNQSGLEQLPASPTFNRENNLDFDVSHTFHLNIHPSAFEETENFGNISNISNRKTSDY